MGFYSSGYRRKVNDQKRTLGFDIPYEKPMHDLVLKKRAERTLRISVEADVFEALEALAEEKSTTASNLVAQMVRQAVDEHYKH